MAMGLAGTTDDVLRSATQNMVRWLQTDHNLTPTENRRGAGHRSRVQGERDCGPQRGVVLKINRERLKGLGGK
jgi:hypothetical protein